MRSDSPATVRIELGSPSFLLVELKKIPFDAVTEIVKPAEDQRSFRADSKRGAQRCRNLLLPLVEKSFWKSFGTQTV
jgi:hypothetical protein